MINTLDHEAVRQEINQSTEIILHQYLRQRRSPTKVCLNDISLYCLEIQVKILL